MIRVQQGMGLVQILGSLAGFTIGTVAMKSKSAVSVTTSIRRPCSVGCQSASHVFEAQSPDL
jgi:hypothetical protein